MLERMNPRANASEERTLAWGWEMCLLRKERTGFVEPARKSIGRLKWVVLDGWGVYHIVEDLPSRSCTFKIKESICQVGPRVL